MAGDQLFELRRTTFDTPNFRGIEFIEVEAKTILNKVPGNYLPFNWTINPYRGCTHACSYCLSGETPILMADGRSKPLAEIRPGDRIYGTVRVGSYRRFITTTVEAHWSTVKLAYRIRLADKTELIASADHRFLSDRGWKHVTGAEQGPSQRPFLTTNNKLIGTGGYATGPKQGPDYRRGYLCGMIRGDGNGGTYRYVREGRTHGDGHRFRLALADFEALYRSQDYLAEMGIPTVDAVRDVIKWPSRLSTEWQKGFLAGIFDAEGSCSNGVFRICNTDAAIIDQVKTSLRRFGFFYAEETRSNGPGKPLTIIRLLGGLSERLRFIHTVDPAVTRKRTMEGAALKSDADLKVVSVESLGFEMRMYDITTGTGDFIANGVVSHNCFARATHTYMDMDAGRDFETKIVVKVNAPDVLRRQLRRKSWKGESVAMGTATDPYQRAEGRYKLMPRIIDALTEVRNPFSILTKGTLILRDLGRIAHAASLMDVSTAFSIGTLDEDVWRKSEPGTPHPRKRVAAVQKLNEAGIPCGVLIAPVLPGISDGKEQLREVVMACIDAGATHVSPILLHLRPKVREVYMEWLAEMYPDLVPSYERMYTRAYATTAEKKALSKMVAEVAAEHPKPRPRPFRRPTPPTEMRRDIAALKNEQMTLL